MVVQCLKVSFGHVVSISMRELDRWVLIEGEIGFEF